MKKNMKKNMKKILACAVCVVVSIPLFVFTMIAKADITPITLIAHYDFNDITGTTVIDKTSNGYNGTLDTGKDVVATNTFVTLNEDSDQNYGKGMTLNSNPFANTSDDVTISAWVKPSTAKNENAIRTFFNLNSGTTSNSSSYAALITKFETNGGIRFLNSGMVQTGGILTQNEWNLMTVVQKGLTNYVYLNGTLLDSFTASAKLKDLPNGVVSFGKGITWPDKGFRGAIDDIKIYNGAMNEIQVSQEYQKTIYPIAGFSIGDYFASIDQTDKTITLCLPENYSLNNVSPVVVSTATEIKINGTDFNEGDKLNLTYGTGSVNYTNPQGSGKYDLIIEENKVEQLANFKFSSDKIDENGNVTDLSGNGHTAKVLGSAQGRTSYVNLSGGYIKLDPTLIAKTGSVFTMSFNVSLNKDFALEHTLLSAGTSETNRLVISTDARGDCEGPRWSLMAGDSGNTVVKSDEFLGFEKWVNITYTQINSRLNIYINGELITSGVCITPASSIGEATTYIGKPVPNVYENAPGLNGQISEFRAYAGAMMDSEVMDMYNSFSKPSEYEVYLPDDSSCDLLSFEYPGKQCTIDIKDYTINVKTTLADLGNPTVTASSGATVSTTKDFVYITAPNGLAQSVYTLNIDAPKSTVAQLDTVKINNALAKIDETNKTVSTEIPSGWDVESAEVVALAKLDGTTEITDNNIIVTSADGSTKKTYALKITVKKQNNAQLDTVKINDVFATINETTRMVSLILPAGTNITTAKVNTVVKDNGTALIENGKITVTAEDGVTKRIYTLSIVIEKYKIAQLESVKINGIKATVNQTNKTVSIQLAYGVKVKAVTAVAKFKGKFIIARGYSKITITAEDGITTATYVLKVTNAKPLPKNIVKNGIAYDKNGKKITGTKVAKVGNAYVAVVNSKVQSGNKVVKVNSKYIAVKSGKVIYKSKAILSKIGSKTFVVSPKGVINLKKLVKIGSKNYTNKSKTTGIYKSKTFKIGKKTYKADKKGVVKKVHAKN